MVLPTYSLYQSKIKFTSPGFEYQPNNNYQLIATNTAQNKMRCSIACNQLASCRIFDYDTISKRCRLFEGDSTTGSVIPSSSTTSVVGTVQISSSLYSSINNQTCQACQQNRYSTCSTNTSRCECPNHTYWNGSICVLQRFENDTCEQVDECRSDLNLTCLTDCYGQFPTCLSSSTYNTTFLSTLRFGITIAGGCNGSSSTNQTILNNPADITLGLNNTLYTGDGNNIVLIFDLNNRTGRVLRTLSNNPSFFVFDNRTSYVYFSVMPVHLVYIWPTNKTIPPSGLFTNNCSLKTLNLPVGIAVDSAGNIYISSLFCNWVTKWAPNAVNSTLVAGSPTGASGSNSTTLNAPYSLALDEPHSHLYVVDRYNHRIQRFTLGSNVGVTVAGGHGSGSAANQLARPTDIDLSRIDGSLYIVDYVNNRIQKWARNATTGITIAGSPDGISGITPYLLNKPYGFAFDDGEHYLYVSDGGNNRIQRFSL